MLSWIHVLLVSIDFGMMILCSLVLFRQKIKPFWKEIAVAVMIGAALMMFHRTQFIYIGVTTLLLWRIWKYHIVPALLIAVSGYMLSVIISTLIFAFIDGMPSVNFGEIKGSSPTFLLTMLLVLMTKWIVIRTFIRKRLGFTFLCSYSRIPPIPQNAGTYLLIFVVLAGILLRPVFTYSVFSVFMPVPILALSAAIFIYVALGKELGLLDEK
ncbi:hypothetical protein [Paenibacillus ferrarius]|uniref:hypothetical protein n=1 Tax=Paenibacillus ferrarius TaxID=1469647 RepID=UPI003D27C9A7